MAYFSLKTKNAETVNKILAKEANIEFSGINVLQDSLVEGTPVFIVLGGDRPAWETGLVGMGVISQQPYDIGYEGRNFKIKVDMKVLLPHPIKREDLVPYRDTYGTIGIAPITKWEPNQALSQVADRNAIALMRAMIEIYPEVKDTLRDFVGEDVFDDVLAPTTKMFPYTTSYGEDEAQAVQNYIMSSQNSDAQLDSATEKIDPSEQKQLFILWMQSQKKNEDGEPYSERTIRNYIREMEKGYKTFTPYQYESPFEIQEVDKISEWIDYLFNAPGFSDFDKKAANQSCSCGFKKYKEFLESNKEQNTNNNKAKGGINKIFYGAPGCGKSHHVADLLKNANVPNENIIRVTFHPEYANCDYIGQIMPTIETESDGREIVKYIFNPGPFTLALLKAYNTTEMVYLIVEEINRGNAAAIFGDMFQLLDRVRDTDDQNFSSSEYPVTNPNMQKYLIENINNSAIRSKLENSVFIPSNLTIFATMNSSDQNVFTLDTAFKRRWYFEQISNDIVRDAQHLYKKWYVPGTDVTWESFLTALNNKILEYKIHSQTNEDKRLGKYFVTKECLTESVENIANVQDVAMEFAYKVLEYIWNDVCKIGREDWFDTERYRTLEDLIDGFVCPRNDESPLSIFQNINF